MRISTSAGPARIELDAAEDPPFLLVLTHGAGGGTDTADLLAARQAGLDLGGMVARVLQPYRVRGARAPGSAARQDQAWLEIIGKLRRRFPGVPLVQGGRSNGARVACRTARAAGAQAVLALAFPLHPPGRPDRSRAAELAEAGTEVLVVNGASDPFGIPEPGGGVRVVVLPGAAHALARQGGAIRRVVGAWLTELRAGVLSDGARPVRGNDLAVRKQIAGVLEHHDTVAEQAPALLRVAGHGAGRLAIGGVRVRTLWRVRAHGLCLLV